MKYYMNRHMVELIRKTPYKSTALPKKLSKILEEGIVGIDNCLFFRCFYEANSHINQRDFEDNTSYENFINEFHLDDYCRKGTLNYVFKFVDRLDKINKEKDVPISITAYVSYDNEDFTFSFVTSHEGENHWIEFNDIDDYQQPLMIIEI